MTIIGRRAAELRLVRMVDCMLDICAVGWIFATQCIACKMLHGQDSWD